MSEISGFNNNNSINEGDNTQNHIEENKYQKYNDYFNKSVQEILEHVGSIKINPSTSSALRGLLMNISHSNEYYPDIKEILNDLEAGKTLDQALDSEEKINIFNILKSNFFKSNKNKIKKQEKVLGPNIVSQLTSICESDYFKNIDTLAFECDMSQDELEEYILLSGTDSEIINQTQQIQDDFSKNLSSIIPNVLKKLEKRNVDIHRIISEFPKKIKTSLNVFNRPSSSYLNAHISKIEDGLLYKYFLFLYIELLKKNNTDYYFSKHSNVKYIGGAIDMGIYFNQVKAFNTNCSSIENVGKDELSELEEKVSQLGSIKKVSPAIIETHDISIKIIPHESNIEKNIVSDKFTYLFSIGVNFKGNNNFGFFRGINIGKDLLSVNQANNQSNFFTLNSQGKLCVGGSKTAISFLNFGDSYLKKVIFTTLIEHLENENEYLDSFFLNKEDLHQLDNKEDSEENIIKPGVTDDYYSANDIVFEEDIDTTKDINQNKNNIRQAFNKLKGYPVNKVYKRFIKILGEPIRATGGSHVVFHSVRTNKNFPFSKHGSSGSQNIGIGLLSKYLKNSGICPTELV